MEPLRAPLGDITVLARTGKGPVAPPPPSRYAAQFEALPPIVHTHRAEREQPPAAVPLAACAVLLLVLAGWLTALPRFASSRLAPGAAGAAPAAFLVLLASALALLVWFWLRLTLQDALLPAAALSVAMLLAGHVALARLAAARVALAGKASKSD